MEDIWTWALLGLRRSLGLSNYQYILQTPALGALSLLCKGLPTYSNNDWHILMKNFILINLFILFHPSTRYSPDTDLGLLPKPAGRLFSRFRLPEKRPSRFVSMNTTQSFILNVPLPYWLATCLLTSQLQLFTVMSNCAARITTKQLHLPLFMLFSSDIYLESSITMS